MNLREQQKIMQDTLNKIKHLAGGKGQEYGNQDALANFRLAAAMDKESMVKACWGMWKKHIVSIQEFVQRHEAGEYTPLAKWDEKLMDNMIYSMLMQCILVEELLQDGRCVKDKCPTAWPAPYNKSCPYCGVSEGEMHLFSCNRPLKPTEK